MTLGSGYWITLCVAFNLVVTGCVQNKEVRKVQAGDSMKSCEELQAELTELGVQFDDVKKESGLTPENAVSFLVFWPGIIYNEVRASKNTNSVNKRINFLSLLYNQNCRGDSNADSQQTVRSRIDELKRLRDDGYISSTQYDRRVAEILKEI